MCRATDNKNGFMNGRGNGGGPFETNAKAWRGARCHVCVCVCVCVPPVMDYPATRMETVGARLL